MQPTDIFELISTQEGYLNSWMQKVFRSFALVVPWLEAPLNHYLAKAYLLCRVVNNIEDCTRPADWKKQRFAKDLEQGVSYLPDEWLQEVEFAPLALHGASPAWRQKVLDNVLDELADATNYVLTLPYDATGYRMASLMSLLPAYQTLLLAAQQHSNLFTPNHHIKISRQTMVQCVQNSQTLVTDNRAMLTDSKRLEQAVKATF